MNTRLSTDQEFKLVVKNEFSYELDRFSLGNWFNQICEALFRSIMNLSEPIIEQNIDQKGYVYWRVFDPVTRQTFYCNSESEIRIWLEQRYVRK